tara:strand:- start:665 stop:835 length:171 start_codon:yes stop_codon:yes gene_type:complete
MGQCVTISSGNQGAVAPIPGAAATNVSIGKPEMEEEEEEEEEEGICDCFSEWVPCG